MNIAGKKIDNLLSNKGKSASQMSRGLKKLGDGSMENGINKVAEYMFKDGSVSGFKKGLGVATVAMGSCVLVYKLYGIIKKKVNEKKQLKYKDKDIIETFEDVYDENIEEVENVEEANENEKVEEVESIEDDDENEKVEEIESVEEAEETEEEEESEETEE